MTDEELIKGILFKTNDEYAEEMETKEMNKNMQPQDKTFYTGAIVILVIALLGIFRLTAMTRIQANTVGVKVSAISGVQKETLPTGYHLKMPFVDKIYKMPTNVQQKKIKSITTQTKDAQWLNTKLDVKYRVSEKDAMVVFKNYTTMENVNKQLMKSAVQRAVEEITVNYDIYEALGSKRNDMYKEIEKSLSERLAKESIQLVSITLTDQDAGNEIEQAIKDESVKQKQVDSAKQDKEKAKIESETKQIQAQADADAQVIKAKGEAQANNVKSESITDNLIKMKEAEAREKHGWVEVQTNGDVIANK